MQLVHRRTLGCVTALGALAITGCGSGATKDAGSSAKTLTIYSSLPLRGAERTQTQPMVNGIQMALEQAGRRVGPFEIQYESLDDSSDETGSWDAGNAAASAQRAARDRSAVGYIGQLNSGSSAVSIPILNAAGMPQVSPANTAVGLTTDEPGAGRGEPEKYYPTGKRTFFRIAPKDTVQGKALATLMRVQKCRRGYILNDSGLYGKGLAANIRRTAGDIGLRVVGNEGLNMSASGYRSLATDIAARGVDCVVFSGSTSGNAVQLFKDLASALPKAQLFGGDGVVTSAFVNPEEGGIPKKVGDRTHLTIFALDPANYPESGQAFLRDYKRRFGAAPDPLAIYGHEAMLLLLDAIKRAGPRGDERGAVLEQLQRTRNRDSVLGRYGLDKNGDTTLQDYGAYKITDGEIEFDRVIKSK